jgi:hypothetical protein
VTVTVFSREALGRLIDAVAATVDRDHRENASLLTTLQELYAGVAPPSPEPDVRPYVKGEKVYVLWLPGSQPVGTPCPVVWVLEDRGETVVTTSGSMDAGRLRRDRRGRLSPVYRERL